MSKPRIFFIFSHRHFYNTFFLPLQCENISVVRIIPPLFKVGLTRTFMELKHESVDYIDDVKASYSYLYKIRTAFNIDWRAGAHHQAERCGDRAKPTVHVASRQRKKGEMHNQPTQKALQMGLFELKKTVKKVNTKLIRICRWGCSSLRR